MPKIVKSNDYQLFERRNTTDVFNRLIIAGVLKVLNRKLVYEQIWNDNDDAIENITVPFFFAFGLPTAERFIQDNYTFFSSDECTEIGLKHVDGNFDFLPQGRIDLTSVNIDAGNITNRFVMGKYTRRVDGEIRSFVSMLYSIPLTFSFNVEIRAENLNTAFKIDQAYREYFYKNKTFYVLYRGMKIPCRIGFPDNLNTDKGGVQYQMGEFSNDRMIKLTMSLSVETYQPVFDPSTEMLYDNRINTISLGTKLSHNDDDKSDLEVYFKTNDIEHSVYPAGMDLYLEWDYRSTNDDNTHCYDLSYYDKTTGDTKYITTVTNTLSHIWRIPDDLGCISPVDVIIPNIDEQLIVHTQPKIRIAPNPENKVVTPNDVYVINKGYFITLDNQVDGTFEYINKSGKIERHPFTLNLRNSMIDIENPIEFEPFVYNADINPRKIDIILENVSDDSIRAVLQDVTII